MYSACNELAMHPPVLAMYTHSARNDGAVIRFELKDHAGRHGIISTEPTTNKCAVPRMAFRWQPPPDRSGRPPTMVTRFLR
jgi:hypothetical protein